MVECGNCKLWVHNYCDVNAQAIITLEKASAGHTNRDLSKSLAAYQCSVCVDEAKQVSERTSGNGYNHPHPLLN